MTAQDIIDLCCGIDFDCILIIVCTFLLLILIVLYSLYQKFQDEKREVVCSYDYSYNNKSIEKLFSQFLDRCPVFAFRLISSDLYSYEKYLITFKGWTAQEVYQKIKEHLESIIKEYINTGEEYDNHALSNFEAEIRFVNDELNKFERQKINPKLSDFS